MKTCNFLSPPDGSVRLKDWFSVDVRVTHSPHDDWPYVYPRRIHNLDSTVNLNFLTEEDMLEKHIASSKAKKKIAIFQSFVSL